MKFILTGGTGFIGQALARALTQKGHELIILTRQQSREEEPNLRKRYLYWELPMEGAWREEIEGADGIINLAGEPIASKRWTRKQKLKILESRADSTQTLVRTLKNIRKRPRVLINASAVGYYGPRGDETAVEKDPPGHDFLSQVCKAWEAHAIRAEDFGLRVVRLRIGIVLEKGGGALQKMIPPFQCFLGGALGSGKQWMSWIHRDDIVGLILFALENSVVRGALNGTAPNPVTMKEFATTLGQVMHRPSFAPVPGFVLKILLGEMSDMLLTGQKVLPEKALTLGYKFRYPTLKETLQACLSRN